MTDVTEIMRQIKDLGDRFNSSLAAERASFDENLKKRDVVAEERTARIEADVSALLAENQRLTARLAGLQQGGTALAENEGTRAHRTAFNEFFRHGEDGPSGVRPRVLRDLEVKAALTTQSNPDGGFTVPEVTEAGIERVLAATTAMRMIARTQVTSTERYSALKSMGGANSGWVGEEDSRTDTNTPTLREMAFTFGEIYAMPAATQTMLEDSVLNVEQWLADEVAIEFSEKEAAAFVSGDGVKKPKGLLSYPTVANGSYAWGSLGFVVTGAAAAFAGTNPSDNLVDLLFALKPGYRANASFLMSDAVMATVRKWKDGQGNYIFSPITAGEMVPSVLGKPVYADDNMPALAANAFPVACGDFQRGYLILDRRGATILRDPYTNKPYVKFYTTKRVGGGVANFEAIKLLKCST